MAINLFQSTSNNSNWNPQKNTKVEGSYRAQFQQIKLEYIPSDGQSTGHPYSTTIIVQQEYKGMSLMMVRLEDYYLIRSQQIQRSHQVIIQNACSQGLFNSKLITNVNIQTLQPPQFQNFRNSWNNNNSNNNYQSNTFSSNNIFNQNNTKNVFQPSQTNDNIFNNPMSSSNQLFQQQSNQSTNIFQQPNNQNNIFNSSNNNNNTNNNNIFKQSTTPTNVSNNLFAQTPNNNIFAQNNQPNIFQQPQQQGFNLFNQPSLFPQNTLYPQNNIFTQPNLYGLNNGFGQPVMYGQPSMYPNPMNYQQFPFYQPMIQPQGQQQITYPQLQQFEKVKDAADILQTYADVLKQKYQQFQELQKNEEQHFEQQELIIQEHERQNQQIRQQRERILNQSLSVRSNKSKSPSPFSISRAGKSSTNYHRMNSSLQRSHIVEYNTSQISNYEENKFDIIVKFLESEKFFPIITQSFKSKSRIEHVKFFIENILSQQNIFGKQRYQYFQMVRIMIGQNIIFDDALYLDEIKSDQYPIQIIFNYFCTIKPKLTKPDYQCNVNFDQMTEQELSNVENFTISNQFGQVRWLTPCNLLYLDLDKIVDLTQECINLYDSEIVNDYLKPEIGKKLNKECEITFNLPLNLKINDASKFEQNLRYQAEGKNIEFIKFDSENRSYTFKVQHFSGYQFNSDYYSSDDSTHLHQVAIQTNASIVFGQVDEEQSSSSSDDNLIEDQLENLKEFNIRFNSQISQLKNFNISNKNEEIIKFNIKNNTKVPINIQYMNNSLQNQKFLSILFLDSQKIHYQSLKMKLSTKLIQLFQITEDKSIKFQLKLFNALFGDTSINLGKYAKNIKKNIFDIIDLQSITKHKQDRGLALSLIFENQKKKQNNDFREVILDRRELNPIQKILLTVNSKSGNNLGLGHGDLIDEFINWRINCEQPKPLYQKEWWQSLKEYIQGKPLKSIDQAALYYYLIKKKKNTEEPSESFDKLLNYLQSSHDTLAYLLFAIIIRKNNIKIKKLKILSRSLLSKLIDNKCNYEIVKEFLLILHPSIFQKEEISRLQNLINKHPNYQEFADDEQEITKHITNYDYKNAIIKILKQQKISEYKQIINDYIIPCLVIENQRQLNDSTTELINQILDNCSYNSDVITLAQIYIGRLEFDTTQVESIIVQNEYQYFMKQKIIQQFIEL
ncbi:unnamed protein product [Paramecium primaurelia]|uniref:Peptidase S59 domain-containing protein n=1 Tax=Paramecium primaurelia TaxID=5886 RepID=A0A8S1JNL3_PARPR|nr:unnamed protein product [Paramecium primaurelia]